VFDQFCLSFHPARIPLCPTKGGLSVRFATLDQKFFEDVNTYNRHIYRMRETLRRLLRHLMARIGLGPIEEPTFLELI
jgi:hypothetical protein